METIGLAVVSLKAAYNVIDFGIKFDQVPGEVRRCLELLRTCSIDLDHLIELRAKHLALLQTRPSDLERINTIITHAYNGLSEVSRLVEKVRPEANDGRIRFRSSLKWMCIDKSEFTSQELLVSRQHSSVIAELGYLRNLALLTSHEIGLSRVSTSESTMTGTTQQPPVSVVWDDLTLLEEMMGGQGRAPGTSNQAPLVGQVETEIIDFPQTQVSKPVDPAGIPLPISSPPPPYSSPSPSVVNLGRFQPPRSSSTNVSISSLGVQQTSRQALQPQSQTMGDGPPNPRISFDIDGIDILFDVKLKVAEPTPEDPIPVSTEQDMPIGRTRAGRRIGRYNASSAMGRRSPPRPTSRNSSGLYLGGSSRDAAPNFRSSTPEPPASGSRSVTPLPPIDLVPNLLSTIPQDLIHQYENTNASGAPKSAPAPLTAPPPASLAPAVPIVSPVPHVPSVPPVPLVPAVASTTSHALQPPITQHQRSRSAGNPIYLSASNNNSTATISTVSVGPTNRSLVSIPSYYSLLSQDEQERSTTPQPSDFSSTSRDRATTLPTFGQFYLGGNSGSTSQDCIPHQSGYLSDASRRPAPTNQDAPITPFLAYRSPWSSEHSTSSNSTGCSCNCTCGQHNRTSSPPSVSAFEPSPFSDFSSLAPVSSPSPPSISEKPPSSLSSEKKAFSAIRWSQHGAIPYFDKGPTAGAWKRGNDVPLLVKRENKVSGNTTEIHELPADDVSNGMGGGAAGRNHDVMGTSIAELEG